MRSRLVKRFLSGTLAEISVYRLMRQDSSAFDHSCYEFHFMNFMIESVYLNFP